MRRMTTVVKVATTKTTLNAQITSREEIKEKDQGTTKETSKGNKAKSMKIARLLTIDPL